MTANPETQAAPFDAERVRADFPALRQKVHGRPLVYLDNAATTQKPQSVIDALLHYYTHDNANIHRGIHALSERSTRAYEDARRRIQRFIGAAGHEEILSVRGTTEGINLVAQTYGRTRVRKGDEIIISWMEHHSNIVPWQILCRQTGAHLRVIPVNDRGELEMEAFDRALSDRTRLVGMVYVSNSIGTVNPVKEIAARAHARGAAVLVDGAQAAPHRPVDVRDLDCDFFVFSGHKLFGPTGTGVVYGRRALLEEMPPYQGGGDMIRSVTFEKTEYNELPFKFEAGTPHVAGWIGLGAAVDYVSRIGMERIEVYEAGLLDYATRVLSEIDGVRFIGTAREKAGILSFVIEGVHAHDVGTVLDREGIAVRAGHHCTMPLMERFKVPATVRASFSFYNTRGEVDSLAAAVRKTVKLFS